MKADPDDLKYVSEAELASVREQIQEDIITFMDDKGSGMDEQFIINNLCHIVVMNFKKLE